MLSKHLFSIKKQHFWYLTGWIFAKFSKNVLPKIQKNFNFIEDSILLFCLLGFKHLSKDQNIWLFMFYLTFSNTKCHHLVYLGKNLYNKNIKVNVFKIELKLKRAKYVYFCQGFRSKLQ